MANTERCPGCSKRVYPNEKIAIDGIGWHRACFKCSGCGSTLKPGSSFAQFKGKYYCKTHIPVLSEKSSNRMSTQSRDGDRGDKEIPLEKKRSSDDVQIKKEEGERGSTPKPVRPESASPTEKKKREKRERQREG